MILRNFLQEWTFLEKQVSKVCEIGNFRSISKNCRNLKIFWPISIQNRTQGIFCFIKKIVSPLLLPLRLIFSFKNALFQCISKNGRNLKKIWPLSIQNLTQGIFCFEKKIVTPLLLPLRLIFPFKNALFYCISKNGRNWKKFWPFSIQNLTQGIFCFEKNCQSAPFAAPLDFVI